MDTTRLITCIQKELSERKGASSMIFQNHLYGCFIVMEDIAQGILDVSDGYLTGNALYLNLDKQFGQIGIRYYGFTMDGKAVLEDITDEYKQAWMEVFRVGLEIDSVDRIEDEVIRLSEDVKEDNFFMNAMEHDGSLTPDWVEKALYALHPHLEGANVQKPPHAGEKVGVLSKRSKIQKPRVRSLAVTRRQSRISSRTQWATTRRQSHAKK